VLLERAGEPEPSDADWLQAWPAWRSSCAALTTGQRPQRLLWEPVCAAAARLRADTGAQVRAFFAAQFDEYRVLALEAGGTSRDTGLFTAYYEPSLRASRTRHGDFTVPVYRAPGVVPLAPRAELMAQGSLQGNELVWLQDPLDAFFLEVQGSGRVQLDDGSQIRLAYAASNGQAYRSIGRWLIEQEQLPADQVTMQAIRGWAQTHPQRVRELLDQNPRVIFFREQALGDARAGPIGTQGQPLTAGVSVAVDPRYLPLGAPLVLCAEASAHTPARVRLAVAQDTGGAIRGPLRIDWFLGSGSAAGQSAGLLHTTGSVRLFVPRGVAPQALL